VIDGGADETDTTSQRVWAETTCQPVDRSFRGRCMRWLMATIYSTIIMICPYRIELSNATPDMIASEEGNGLN